MGEKDGERKREREKNPTLSRVSISIQMCVICARSLCGLFSAYSYICLFVCVNVCQCLCV